LPIEGVAIFAFFSTGVLKGVSAGLILPVAFCIKAQVWDIIQNKEDVKITGQLEQSHTFRASPTSSELSLPS
jgi:hypothetical protein